MQRKIYQILILILLFTLIFYLVADGILQPYDNLYFRAINNLGSINSIALINFAITELGTEVFLFFLAIALFISYKSERYQLLLGVLIAITLSDLIVSILKAGYFRARPYDSLSNVNIPFGKDEGSSFPSGHSTRAFAVFTLLILRNGKKYIPIIAIPLSVAVSRVILGVHYPSDVTAGAILGISIAILSLEFVERKISPRIRSKYSLIPLAKEGKT